MGGMKCLLLLLCAGVTVSSAVDLQKRVIHGKQCGERKYHVMLIRSDGTDSFLCGGSLISDSYVLTAAHCWVDGWGMIAFVGVHPGPPDPPQGVKITEHHIYSDNKGNHDIMLLKLEQPIKTSTKITHINLPSDQECDKRHQLTVQIAGYGATTVFSNGTKGNDKPTKLHCGEMKVEECPDFTKCPDVQTSTDPVISSMVYAHMLCGNTSKVDAANGDSGGGVVYNYRIYGVHSNSGKKACKVPANFMDVCKYKTWIEGIVAPRG